MNSDRIIQIIPAPANMRVRHIGTDNGQPYESFSRVVCLALMEEATGRYRYVEPMVSADGESTIEEASAFSDFDSIEWKETIHDQR